MVDGSAVGLPVEVSSGVLASEGAMLVLLHLFVPDGFSGKFLFAQL